MVWYYTFYAAVQCNAIKNKALIVKRNRFKKVYEIMLILFISYTNNEIVPTFLLQGKAFVYTLKCLSYDRSEYVLSCYLLMAWF